MALDKDTVRRIAALARLRVPEEALESLAGELSHILGWIEQLDETDTDGIDPMTSVVAMRAPQRQDQVNDGGIKEDVLGAAPGRQGDFYTVPKVVE